MKNGCDVFSIRLTWRTFRRGWKVPPPTGAPMDFRFTLLKLRSLQCVPGAICRGKRVE